MKSAYLLGSLATLVVSRPLLSTREVPQEHSHEKFLTSVRSSLLKNNPDGIVDPVFGLLGNAAAKQGLGKLTDTECLQTATADRAFTNAKAAGDVNGMVGALTYRALERNSGSVGLKTNPCTSFVPVNPQIAALSQHQDPASAGAAATNKAIELELAKQIAAVGGDPQLALESATFAPGKIGDPTAKGNSCDDQNDPVGCALSRKLTVPQVTPEEINAAIAGKSSAAGSATTGSTATGSTSASASPSVNDSSNACSSGNTSPSSTTTTNPSSPPTEALSFGAAQCSDPAMAFGPGFGTRKATEFTFAPDDTSSPFNHGEAFDAGIIAQFICDRLNDTCKAPAATVAACRAVQAKVEGKKNDPTVADEFNNALGVRAVKRGVSAAPTA